MYVAGRKVSHLRLVGCLLPLFALFAPIYVHAQQTRTFSVIFSRHQDRDLSGTYSGRAPASDAAKRVFTLNLAADGTATLDTLYIGKDYATERGRWKLTGNQLELTFDPLGSNQPPRPIIFRHHDHQLSPVHWDANEWGRVGPPVLHRAPRATAAVRSSYDF